MAKNHESALTAMFLLVLFALPVTQAGWELTQGERPQCLDVLLSVPSEDNLRTFETDLEDQSIVADKVQPLVRRLRFAAFADLGPKALPGVDNWLFYQPGIDYLLQPEPADDSFPAGPAATVNAIIRFRDQLKQRGIHLLVVPVPGKASIYLDRLNPQAAYLESPFESPTFDIIRRLRQANVETVDLFKVFHDYKHRTDFKFVDDFPELYLRHDTHWAPIGVRLAAQSIAKRLRDLKWVDIGDVKYELKSVGVTRRGDIVKMIQLPAAEDVFESRRIECHIVRRDSDGSAFQPSIDSPVLLLGDSFSRIYETDAPGSAGLAAHLAHQLQLPLSTIINDGGASTLVRQQLSQRPELLKGKRVVIWQFAERDIRFGNEGWQDVPLPDSNIEPIE